MMSGVTYAKLDATYVTIRFTFEQILIGFAFLISKGCLNLVSEAGSHWKHTI